MNKTIGAHAQHRSADVMIEECGCVVEHSTIVDVCKYHADLNRRTIQYAAYCDKCGIRIQCCVVDGLSSCQLEQNCPECEDCGIIPPGRIRWQETTHWVGGMHRAFHEAAIKGNK